MPRPDPISPMLLGDKTDLEIRLGLVSCLLVSVMQQHGLTEVKLDDYNTIDSELTINFNYNLPGCSFRITK